MSADRVALHELNHAARSRSQLEISYHGSTKWGRARARSVTVGWMDRSVTWMRGASSCMRHQGLPAAQRDAQQSVVGFDQIDH